MVEPGEEGEANAGGEGPAEAAEEHLISLRPRRHPSARKSQELSFFHLRLSIEGGQR